MKKVADFIERTSQRPHHEKQKIFYATMGLGGACVLALGVFSLNKNLTAMQGGDSVVKNVADTSSALDIVKQNIGNAWSVVRDIQKEYGALKNATGTTE